MERRSHGPYGCICRKTHPEKSTHFYRPEQQLRPMRIANQPSQGHSTHGEVILDKADGGLSGVELPGHEFMIQDDASSPGNGEGPMLRSFGKTLIVVAACAASHGCTSSCCYDFIDNTMTGCSDHLEAKMAWHRCSGCFSEVEYYTDFRDGFIAGYIHVMNGGGCCRPTLPPRKYWSLCTRGPDNNCRIVAWYNGWDSGVAQALRDGMGSNPILTAPDIYHNTCPYPVELPEDLQKTEVYEEDLQLEQDINGPIENAPLPVLQEEIPAPNVQAPPPERYNPPAAPMPMTDMKPVSRQKVRVAMDESLTPPAPPRE